MSGQRIGRPASACPQCFPATLKLLRKELGPRPTWNELCISHIWTWPSLSYPLCIPVLSILRPVSSSNQILLCTGSLRLSWKFRCLRWTQILNWQRDSVFPLRYHNFPIFLLFHGLPDTPGSSCLHQIPRIW